MLDLSSKKRVRGAKFWRSQVNQLYHPTGDFDQDSQDLVYSADVAQKTKFLPILLKEWFYLIKKDGYLIIDYRSNKFCNFQKLERGMWWLWQGKYDISYHGLINRDDLASLTREKLLEFIKATPVQETMPKFSKGYFRFICKKIESTKKPGDDIDKWTFGMITKGERDDYIEEIIKSIRALRVPNYEIIVCGTYRDRKEKNFKYIPFAERDDRGWITKKKNVIARNAKYENLCIIHDRIVFDKSWFKGMKKYGNCFEILCNVQKLVGAGYRTGDWITWGAQASKVPYRIAQLDYSDWDYYVYMGGMFSIMKKSVWAVNPWDETRYWGEWEDVELSHRARDLGFLARFNPYSHCKTLAWRFGQLPTKYDMSDGLLPKDMLVRRLFRVVGRVFYRYPIVKRMLDPFVEAFLKTGIYSSMIRK